MKVQADLVDSYFQYRLCANDLPIGVMSFIVAENGFGRMLHILPTSVLFQGGLHSWAGTASASTLTPVDNRLVQVVLVRNGCQHDHHTEDLQQ